MREKQKLPKLVRFLLINAAIGFGLAIVFVGALIAFDVNGLQTLIWASDIGVLALFVLTFFTGLTFASVQIGVAVMLLGEDVNGSDDRADGSAVFDGLKQTWTQLKAWLTDLPHHKMVPIPIKIKNPKR